MTTTTLPERKTPPWRQQADPQSLQERIKAVREQFPGLQEARLAVLDLQSKEQSLLAKLKTPPNPEDPHAHDSVRTKLADVREKIGPAQVA